MVYFDDIFIYNKTKDKHLDHLIQVFFLQGSNGFLRVYNVT